MSQPYLRNNMKIFKLNYQNRKYMHKQGINTRNKIYRRRINRNRLSLYSWYMIAVPIVSWVKLVPIYIVRKFQRKCPSIRIRVWTNKNKRRGSKNRNNCKYRSKNKIKNKSRWRKRSRIKNQSNSQSRSQSNNRSRY